MISAQNGDEIRYRQLLDELSEVIHRYLISRFGYHDFLEDCVQDTLLAIHNARHTYDGNRLFRPWFFAIVRHKSIDALRKRRAEQAKITQQGLEDLATNDYAVQACSSHEWDTSITQGRLINALAPPFRQAIVLTKLVGFSNAEAAQQLSISETALKVRVHRGIAKLKRLVEAEEV